MILFSVVHCVYLYLWALKFTCTKLQNFDIKMVSILLMKNSNLGIYLTKISQIYQGPFSQNTWKKPCPSHRMGTCHNHLTHLGAVEELILKPWNLSPLQDLNLDSLCLESSELTSWPTFFHCRYYYLFLCTSMITDWSCRKL